MKEAPLVIALVIAVALSITACGTEKSAVPAAAQPETVTVVVTQPADMPTVEESPTVEEADETSNETSERQNARESAESYLQTGAFSRKSLIGQLKFEGYSRADAEYAVDAISPNWNEQAVKSAESYLETSSFSRSSLIEQLKFEGFTAEQAEYGVQQAY